MFRWGEVRSYIFMFSAIIVYSLVQFWPRPALIDENAKYVVVVSNGSSENTQAFTCENAKHVVVVSSDGSTDAQTFIGEKANSSNSPVQPVTFFGWIFELEDEERLLLIVAFTVALGSFVHALLFLLVCRQS